MVLSDSYYNILLTRFLKDSKPSETRWMVSVSAFKEWMDIVGDLHCSEVVIRDMEQLSFDVPTSFTPRWFKYGD